MNTHRLRWSKQCPGQCPGGLTDFLYQRDREIIAFARPDLAVSGTGSLFVAQAVDIRVMSEV